MAGLLGVSRNAVWKAVKSLQEDGYEIEASTNKGYRLSRQSDILSGQSIEKFLSGNFYSVEYVACTDSTNNLLKTRAAEGAPEGTVVVAGQQSAGKGRMNRSFYSPPGTGLYMSVLLRPQVGAEQSLFITAAAAVAVASAIDAVSENTAGIKWVNDVYLHGRKVCGILTEASFSMENGGIEYAVLGIGVNILPPAGGFPLEIKNLVSTVFTEQTYYPEARSRLAAEILNDFLGLYQGLEQKTFLEEYRRRSVLANKEITIIRGGREQKAVARGIDDRFRLVAELPDGSQTALYSGEVSIRYREEDNK